MHQKALDYMAVNIYLIALKKNKFNVMPFCKIHKDDESLQKQEDHMFLLFYWREIDGVHVKFTCSRHFIEHGVGQATTFSLL